MSKKVFKIPVTWQMAGYVYVEAENEEDAVERAGKNDVTLPNDRDYIDDSFTVEGEDGFVEVVPENEAPSDKYIYKVD